MDMNSQAVMPAVVLTLISLLASACVSSDQVMSRETIRSGAPWAQDLNAPPPSREPANEAVERLRADLNTARGKAAR